jgi:hypothetical protein
VLFLRDLGAFQDVLVALLVEQRDIEHRCVINQLSLCEMFSFDWQELERLDFVPVGVFAIVAPSSVNYGAAICKDNLNFNVRIYLSLVVDLFLVCEYHVLATILDPCVCLIGPTLGLIDLVILLETFSHLLKEVHSERDILSFDDMNVNRSF